MPNYQRGEIINVDLGKPPNEIKGHEQGFDRPCIVIRSFPQLKLAIVIPCTTTTPKQSYYTIVKILQGSGGLTSDSYALCHQVRTISYDRIISKRGTLLTTDYLKVKAVLDDTLSF